MTLYIIADLETVLRSERPGRFSLETRSEALVVSLKSRKMRQVKRRWTFASGMDLSRAPSDGSIDKGADFVGLRCGFVHRRMPV